MPSCRELLDIADELGIFADHLADPVLPGSGPAPEPAQQVQQTQAMALSGGTPTSAAATMAPDSVQPADALAGAAGGSSSTATASSSASAALMPRFPGLPGDAGTAVAAALQAAQAAGMPAPPAWQLAQQAAQQGGKQTGDAAALAEQYTSLDRMERLSFKVGGCGCFAALRVGGAWVRRPEAVSALAESVQGIAGWGALQQMASVWRLCRCWVLNCQRSTPTICPWRAPLCCADFRLPPIGAGAGCALRAVPDGAGQHRGPQPAPDAGLCQVGAAWEAGWRAGSRWRLAGRLQW